MNELATQLKRDKSILEKAIDALIAEFNEKYQPKEIEIRLDRYNLTDSASGTFYHYTTEIEIKL